ncbi:MAG TPA: AsnC family transcriptional regulator [Candidatus Bathyarchaeia archaeon]|nr:AsnC family transcriptional regulator [Candidatus Bathyarchaeia archaeon]
MPLQLDNYDVSILRSLLKDGRKSFREISRETGITTPTVKARFNRLVNVGFLKSVSPIFDSSLVEKENFLKPELDKKQQGGIKDSGSIEKPGEGHSNNKPLYQQESSKFKIKRGLKIKLNCQFCKGTISANPYVYRFANYERFFCCTGCMSGYKKKYAGRIESIKRRFKEEKNPSTL